MGGRGSGAKGVPRRDRTGEEHPSLTVLGPQPGVDFAWLCRCRACGGTWSVPSRWMAEYIRKRVGCGCRMGTNLNNADKGARHGR